MFSSRRVAAGPFVALLSVVALVLTTLLSVAPAASATTIPGQFWTSKLKLTKVWKVTRGAGVTVAVVDSGVPSTSGLGNRLLAGKSFVGGSAQSDPGKAPGGGGPAYSHGQQIAQYIASDGADGIIGIAPQAKILPVKVQAETGGDLSPEVAAQGIRYAAAHGASVVNVSIGGSGACDSASAAAIKYAYQRGVIVVVGSGNDGQASVEDPANCPGALAVSAVAANAAPWSGSDYGPQVDLTNYGVKIPSTALNGARLVGSGTSLSTAFTSGEIALLRAKYPDDSARAIVTRLLYGSDTLSNVPTGRRVNDHVGYGLPVPLAALTAKIPSGYNVNPIYDQFAEELGPGSGNSSSNPSSGSSTGPSSGGATAPSTDAPSTSSASGGGGGGISPILIVVIVVVVVAAIVIAVIVARSRRRRPPPGGGYGPPPPGGGYGPPPQGYGPPGR